MVDGWSTVLNVGGELAVSGAGDSIVLGDGHYAAVASVEWDANASGGRFVRVCGTGQPACWYDSRQASPIATTFFDPTWQSTPLGFGSFAAGNVLDVTVLQDSGVSLDAEVRLYVYKLA